MLNIAKKKQSDVIKTVDAIRASVEEFSKNGQVKGLFEHNFINDKSDMVRRRMAVLANNLGIGLVLVLGFLSIVLPVRVAFVTALGIPFAFLATLALFHTVDVSLNMLTMMGLIIVLGMLVDDAIVVAENAQRYLEKGLTPLEAAIKGTQQIWKPVIVSVLTTVAAFLPILFMSGIYGEFISYIAIGVIVALAFSLVECFLILPSHVADWVKPSGKPGRYSFATLWQNFVVPVYLKILGVFLKLRYVVAIAAMIASVFSIKFAADNMDFELFPGAGNNQFSIKYSTGVGTPIEQTEIIADQVERIVKNITGKDIETYTTKIGAQSNELPFLADHLGSQYAQTTVYLKPEEELSRTKQVIMQEAKDIIEGIEKITSVTFEAGREGAPVGKALSVDITGSDYDQIINAAADLERMLRQIEGVTDIKNSYETGKDELVISLDESALSLAGLTKLDVANTVRATFKGIVSNQIEKIDEEIDVRVTLPKKSRQNLEALNNVRIPNNRGNLIKLSSVATVEKQTASAAFSHIDSQRRIIVTSEVIPGQMTSAKINDIVEAKFPDFIKKYPAVNFRLGGEEADGQESFEALGDSFLIAILGIVLLLILQFGNFTQPILILCMIPMGILAVIWAFFFHGMPLSFLGLIGIVALAGVIVNNAIVFIDFFNQEVKGGKTPNEAIKVAAVARVRPIFLTTITTVAGILPTAYGLGGLDPFVVPIAIALGWGMLIGSILTCLILPVIIAIHADITMRPKLAY